MFELESTNRIVIVFSGDKEKKVNRTLVGCLALICFSSHAGADPVTVSKSYSYSHPTFAAQDSACISSFMVQISPRFRGLLGISLGSNSIIETQSGALATYAGVEFESLYGNVKGTINCVFAANRQTVTDVAVVFEGRGLGGDEKHPLKADPNDPASWRAKTLAVGGFN